LKELIQDLIALQDVELEIFKAEAGLKDTPKEIEEIDGIILARKRSLDAIDEEIAELEKRKVPLDTELAENQAILDAADARIKRIKTNKEYLALQREIDLAKKRKADMEEQILTLMDKIERRQKDKERIHESFEEDKALLEKKKKKLFVRCDELEKIINGYKGKVEKLRKKVDPSLLSRYDRIKQNKKGLAVVLCESGVCKGCHMHIPPQLFNELVRGDTLIVCPACQRILYTDLDPQKKEA